LEGITFIDSRVDGRYFISNGKDQTIKLWDIRKMTSGSASSRFIP
jgi:WD repeat-containing protein 23